MKRKNEASRRLALDSCPDWVRDHKDCRPWGAKGLIFFRARIAETIRRYSAESYDETIERVDDRDELVERLFACWIEHWKREGTNLSPLDVAVDVETKKTCETTSGFRPNPFFDVVHASALRNLQRKAELLFTRLYADMLVGIAKKLGWVSQCSNSESSVPDWWNDFFYFLTVHSGKDRSKPAIYSYSGAACLKFWLGATFTSFLPGWFKNYAKCFIGAELDETLDARKTYGVSEETFARIFEAVTQAARALDKIEYLRLAFHYRDKLANNDVALIFGEKAYETTRRRQSAFRKFTLEFYNVVIKDERLRELFFDPTTGYDAVAELTSGLSDAFDDAPTPQEYAPEAVKKTNK